MALCTGCQLFPRLVSELESNLQVGFISTPFISCTDKCHYFRLLQSADAFHTAKDLSKTRHSEAISILLYTAHALPLACKSKRLLKSICHDNYRGFGCEGSFHQRWPLDGWNDNVIQPARDAVLNYFKVHVSIYPSTVLALNPFNQTLFIYSLLQRYAEPSDVEEYMRRNNLS